MSKRKRVARAVIAGLLAAGAITAGSLAGTWAEYLFFWMGLVVGGAAMYLDLAGRRDD